MELRLALRQLSRGSYGTVRNLGEENFLRKHQDLFCMQSNGYIVDAIFPVNFCRDILGPDGCTQNCPDLHLCPFHLLNECEYVQCVRSHDPNDNHTQRIFHDRLKLSHLSSDERRRLLQTIAKDKESHWRTPLGSIPEPCVYYNRSTGCGNGDWCSFLHVCSYWLKGTCNFGRTCKRDHNFGSKQNEDILKRDGLYGLPESQIKYIILQEEEEEGYYY